MSCSERDDILIRSVLSGDQNAFNKLIEFYREKMFFVCLNIVKNKMVADDLVQDSVIRIHEKLNLFDDTYAFSTWAFKIVKNICFEYIKNKRVEVVGLSFFDVSDNSTVEEEYMQNECISIIEKCVSNLPIKYRSLLDKRLKGESYLQIAEELELEIGVVKTRLFRGRQILLKKIKECGLNGELGRYERKKGKTQ